MTWHRKSQNIRLVKFLPGEGTEAGFPGLGVGY